MTILRTKAQEAVYKVFHDTLERVRADALVRSSCRRTGGILSVAGFECELGRFRRIVVLGAGKAASAMAQAVEGLAGNDLPLGGLVVTKNGHSVPTKQIEVIEAGHPIPDDRSQTAGRRILELAATVNEQDLVIVLLSGGASALIESLVPGVELRDLRAITKTLLESGANITELNTVRARLSEIKAGGLARACGKATLLCLVLSDVIGNSLETIGSGPCWGAPPSNEAALRVLETYRVEVPPHVLQAMADRRTGIAVHPPHFVIGDHYTLLEAALRAAEQIGLRPKVYSRPFSGEAREVGARMAAEALSLGSAHDCIIAAGETTVTVRGNGIGGRNQEVACAAGIALEGVPDVAVLAGGTDGTDGPTDAAGGLVDGETYKRADLRRALDRNDSYQALHAAGALVVTGPTQTNLNDLVVIARVSE